MDKKQLIEILQQILETEYTDVFIYYNEAGLFEKKIKEADKLVKTYKDFSLDELRHADIISQKILSLGGRPVWEYKNFFIPKSIKESLKLHLERETKSYQTYNNLIKNIDDRDFKITLKGIRENEKEHIEEITDFLKELKDWLKILLHQV